MMDGLKMPFILPGNGIHGHHGIGEQVVARAISTPVIRSWAAERHIYDAAFFIHGHVPAPDVDARAFLPAVVEPGFVARFAGTRHGVKLPELSASARIVGARIACRTGMDFSDRSAEHGDIF